MNDSHTLLSISLFALSATAGVGCDDDARIISWAAHIDHAAQSCEGQSVRLRGFHLEGGEPVPLMSTDCADGVAEVIAPWQDFERVELSLFSWRAKDDDGRLLVTGGPYASVEREVHGPLGLIDWSTRPFRLRMTSTLISFQNCEEGTTVDLAFRDVSDLAPAEARLLHVPCLPNGEAQEVPLQAGDYRIERDGLEEGARPFSAKEASVLRL